MRGDGSPHARMKGVPEVRGLLRKIGMTTATAWVRLKLEEKNADHKSENVA